MLQNHPSLTQLWLYLVLTANFLYDCDSVKREAARLGLADTIHKVWLWCTVHSKHLVLALDLLITFTADCPAGKCLLVTFCSNDWLKFAQWYLRNFSSGSRWVPKSQK